MSRKKPSAIEIGILATTMTKTEIAKHYEVSPSTIERWYKGYGIPHTIKELAEWAISQNPELEKNLDIKKANHLANVKKKEKTQ